MIGSSTVQSQTGETHKHVGRYIKVNRFCRVSGGPKGCQPGSIASPNHINLRDLFFKCNHYLHNELHFDFAFDFDFSRVMLMCSLLTRPLCISLETRLVLNIDCMKQFSLCVCVLLLSLLMFPADWLMFKQLQKRRVWRISCSVYIPTFARWWPVCRCDEQNGVWSTHYWCLRSASSPGLIYFFLVALHH